MLQYAAVTFDASTLEIWGKPAERRKVRDLPRISGLGGRGMRVGGADGRDGDVADGGGCSIRRWSLVWSGCGE